ncbi:class I SAM-dependent DNA methyltransferase [Qipengyuania sp. G39]|uniref:site-specific DNA-methyltransferase (adenine-specific) n=1 Tax=Qipengyuania profundimaris TaxID=3067652 RepID=A0ABT9HLT7_9SPHN|nr:DNA methyltransferase [Qipengyuania sp. G39]MDP4574108.1 class I SAM-dependent DNA methyltransferase [Qipengyuania sp. G39]
MTPTEFIQKWRSVDLKERTASQSHFNDICRLLDIEEPISADPKGEWFTFEKGASKTGGGEGWADVWRKECFAWEYKGKKKDLDRAFAQLQQYAIALDNPPLLIVSDMDRFRVHTNWTNTVQEMHEFSVEDLLDGATRDLLRNCFLDPERLKPAKTRQMLTEEAAEEFSQLAQRLRERGHEAHAVAHFVNRLVFCMFAEDVRLLPDQMFTKMLKASIKAPERFELNASKLFAAMHKGGDLDFTPIEWFNGGLFDDDSAFPLQRDDIDNLLAAAELDWSEIDPSILGTLFERGLDPSKRSQLGAHYTDREKIMQIVEPVLIRPLMDEWAQVRVKIGEAIAKAEKAIGGARTKAENEAKKLQAQWHERLRKFRVLDPACGSGNFLYLSLLALKDIEHLTNLEAEALSPSLAAQFPNSGPENVLGIELNTYAAELARVSVWIGEIQWMRRNGFEAAKNPILRSLGNIENRDAVLVTDDEGNPTLNAEGQPQRAAWPEADLVVGNPPFLGDKKMIAELGEDYTIALRKAWPQVPGGADLVCYWVAGAWDRIAANKLQRAGLVATNSIRGGSNRDVLKPIVEQGRISDAWSDEEWTVEGAAVRVSLICFDRQLEEPATLNGEVVLKILSDLSANLHEYDLSRAKALKANSSTAFIGDQKSGPFDIPYEEAAKLLLAKGNPHGRPNAEVLRPWMNGMDLSRRPAGKWIIDFGSAMSLPDAMLYEMPFSIVEENVKPMRANVRRDNHRENWWIHGEARPGMRRALSTCSRFLATPRVAKHRMFAWLDSSVLPDCQLVVIARDDDATFGILQSRFHELWALRMGTSLEDRPRYTPSTTFETFPFPEGLTPDIPSDDYADDPRAQAIAAAAARLDDLRQNWLNPPDLVERVPEVIEGFPDRILPKDEAATKELKKRTLTNLYNIRPAWLDHAHRVLDEAVAEAYGWADDFCAGILTDEEILARLFQLNQERGNKSS